MMMLMIYIRMCFGVTHRFSTSRLFLPRKGFMSKIITSVLQKYFAQHLFCFAALSYP